MTKNTVETTANPELSQVINAFSKLRDFYGINFRTDIKEDMHKTIIQITQAENLDFNQETQNCISTLHNLYKFFGSPES